MKTATLIALVSVLLVGCSYSNFTNLLPVAPSPLPPGPTATATIHLTPTNTATITATLPTPTFTGTPTLIYPNGRPAPSETPSAAATLWISLSETPTVMAQPLVGSGPFATILVSGQRLFWGSCEPSSVKASVKVADSAGVHSVLIFLRLQDTKSKDTTQWGGGAIMDHAGNGVFTYNLTAKSFEHYREYMQAWGQYQFVALDSHLSRIGASAQYLSNLTIQPCP